MPPEFDLDAAHKHFSAHCFNAAWDLMDKAERTAEEDQMMLALNQASIYHWRSRPDCTAQNLSVGYWQTSRIYALLGNAPEAQRYGEICLSYSQGLEPFYLGYAYEALARAAFIAGEHEKAKHDTAQAEAQAAQVTDQESREMLRNDLAALR